MSAMPTGTIPMDLSAEKYSCGEKIGWLLYLIIDEIEWKYKILIIRYLSSLLTTARKSVIQAYAQTDAHCSGYN